MKRALTAMVCCALALAGCGHTAKHPVVPPPRAVAQACPPNRSYMGCSALAPGGLRKLGVAPGRRSLTSARVCMFPDVSVWQGAVGWTSVAAWQRSRGCAPAGAFKLGEYTLDVQAARNASETRRLGFWRMGYWFVRNTGCAHEAALIVWAARRYNVKLLAEDIEAPEARNYAACLTPTLERAGLVVVIYTAPGTWPGGSGFGIRPLWQATYGSSFRAFWHPVLAWQCTDGKFGCVTNIPGIGRDDVSIDYGITRLGAKPKPKLICFGPRAQLKNKTCEKVRPEVARWSRAREDSRRVLNWALGIQKGYHCLKPAKVHSNTCPRVAALIVQKRQQVAWFDRQARSTFLEFV